MNKDEGARIMEKLEIATGNLENIFSDEDKKTLSSFGGTMSISMLVDAGMTRKELATLGSVVSGNRKTEQLSKDNLVSLVHKMAQSMMIDTKIVAITMYAQVRGEIDLAE